MLKALKCENTNCTETSINIIDGNCNRVNGHIIETGKFESQAIGSDGFPIFAYYERATLKMGHCGDPFCSDTDNITRSIVDLRTTQFTENGAYTAITVGSDGFPLIAYHDVLDSSLNVCTNYHLFISIYK